MVNQACQQSWEALAQLESQRAALLTELPESLASVQGPERAGVVEIIRQIQECDRAVLEYVMPWREQVGALLARLKTPPTR